MFKSYRLKYKEKFGNSCRRQLLRMAGMLIRKPSESLGSGILKVMLGLTYDCQCNCSYCCSGSYPKEKEKELSTVELKDLIGQISCMPSLCTLVSFFGGEALLRGDIFELVAYAAKKGLFTEIETNGILLSPENVKKLKQGGLHHLFVRVESPDPRAHDGISHFEGCFIKAVEGIGHCVSEKLPCSISTVATKEKVHNHDLEKIIDLARRLKAASVRLLHPTLSGKWLREVGQLLNEEEKSMVARLLEPDFVYLESTDACTKGSSRICPSRQKKLFYVSCYGEVQPCPFVPDVFGNIRDEKMVKIRDRMWQAGNFSGSDKNGCLAQD